MTKRLLILLPAALAVALIVYFLSGLTPGRIVTLYYFDTLTNAWSTEPYETRQTELSAYDEGVLALDRLQRLPEQNPLWKALPKGIVTEQDMDGNMFIVRFSADYDTLSRLDKNTAVAAVVYTLTEIPGVDGVFIYAGDGETPLTGPSPLNRDGVIINSELLPNNIGTRTLTLYFANADGTALEAVQRQVEFQPNMPIGNHAVEELIAGPDAKEQTRLVPSDAMLRDNVTLDGGICYADFAADFLTRYENEESLTLAVYSIVYTLMDNTGAQQVQLLFGGDKTAAVHGTLDLGKPLSKDLEPRTENLEPR